MSESQELEEHLHLEDDNTFNDLAWYMINPESNFSIFQNVQVQVITWFTLILTPYLLVYGMENPELSLDFYKSWIIITPIEWIVDISWSIEICLNFITAD